MILFSPRAPQLQRVRRNLFLPSQQRLTEARQCAILALHSVLVSSAVLSAFPIRRGPLTQFPDTLVKQLRRGLVIPFAGAGVSRAVLVRSGTDLLPRFPTWRELLLAAGHELRNRGQSSYASIIEGLLALDPPRFLEAARYAREGLTDGWFDFLRHQLDPPFEGVDDESLELARTLWAVSQLIITTNYDRVFAWATASGVAPEVWSIQSPSGLAAMLHGDLRAPTVWHLHGHISSPEDVILTPDRYPLLYGQDERFSTRYEAALTALRSVLLSRTLLFVGFSFDDADVGDQLRWASRVFEGEVAPHYLLTRQRDVDRVRLRLTEANIEIVPYPDHGPPLLATLRALLGTRDGVSHTRRLTRTPFDNLPRRSPLPLLGRASEHSSVVAHLSNGDFVSIEGTGGTGKTTLALAVAHAFLEMSPEARPFDAVVWLSAQTSLLTVSGQIPRESSVTDVGSVVATIAQTLGRFDILYESGPARSWRLHSALRETRTLVIVDNFETVRDPAIFQFLRELPDGSAALITSREKQDADFVCHLPELRQPELKQLVALELERRELTLAPQMIDKIAERSGGLPLAAVWLTGRIAHDGIESVVADIEAEDLLKFTFGEQLESVSDTAADLMRALSFFPAGAEIVDLLRCVDGAEPDHIRELGRRSLLERDGAFVRLLPLTKELVLGSPSGSDEALRGVQTRVIDAIVAFAERETAAIVESGSHRSTWRRHRDNVFWALSVVLEHPEPEKAAALIVGSYWPMLMHGELMLFNELAARVLRNIDLSELPRADVCLRLASAWYHLDDVRQAEEYVARARNALHQSASVPDDTTNMFNFLSAVIAVHNNDPNAEAILVQSIDFERKRGVVWTLVGFLGWLGVLHCKRERWRDAEAVCVEALQLARSNGLVRSQTFVSVPLTTALLHSGRLNDAARACDEALALADDAAEMHNLGHLSQERAVIALRQGDLSLAKEFATRARDIYASLGLASRADRAADRLQALGIGDFQ
jgi:tetratricopeptide (TPR) repeat protein